MKTDLSTQSSAAVPRVVARPALPDPAVAASPARTSARGRRRLGTTASLVLLGSMVISFLAGSSAPTPLYATYAAQWRFGPITVTSVFAVYAIVVLVGLLTFGRLSDHIGRKPVLFAALAGQFAAMLIFLFADGVPALYVARAVQGLAAGAALGALGAAMVDADRDRGTLTNTLTPGMGTGSGALISALLVRYLPAPTHLVYVALAAVFVLQAVALVRLPETVTRVPGALGSLVPDFAVPRAARAAVITAMPVLFAGWALPGFYASLGPALIRQLSGSSSVILGALGLFILAGVTPFVVAALRNTSPARVMVYGVSALVVGVAVTLLAVSVGSLAAFFVGTAVAGVGFGSAFQGGIRLAVPLAQPHERAGLLSVLFVVSYLGMGLPAVVAGILVARVSPLLTVTREYGGFVILLAAVAGISLWFTHRRGATA